MSSSLDKAEFNCTQEEANRSDLEEIPLPSDEEEDSDAEKAKPAKKKPGPKPKSAAEKAEKAKPSAKAKDKKKEKAAAEESDGDVASGHDDDATTGAKRKVCSDLEGRIQRIHKLPSKTASCAEAQVEWGRES